MSQIELAWTSMKKHSQLVKINSNQLDRFHPTQKPVKLYKWLLTNYAKENDKILDTHLGSGSIALACHQLGFDLTACELDLEYYEAAHKRFKQQTAQLRLKL
jgi:site-specific DNA-methyltransferase (adenine-specific)